MIQAGFLRARLTSSAIVTRWYFHVIRVEVRLQNGSLVIPLHVCLLDLSIQFCVTILCVM